MGTAGVGDDTAQGTQERITELLSLASWVTWSVIRDVRADQMDLEHGDPVSKGNWKGLGVRTVLGGRGRRIRTVP